MSKRAAKLLAVILSVGLLALCLSPVIGSCHTCHDSDCVICRAVDFVSGLMKTAGPVPLLSAGAALSFFTVLRKKESVVASPAASPVALHTLILS